VNIAGLRGKDGVIKKIIEKENLDFMGIAETWLKEFEETSLFVIEKK
jgi:hypothetical protein